MASISRRILNEHTIYLYPFGNTPAKNLLVYLNKRDYKPLRVLLLGSGDLRHVLYTLWEESAAGHVEFYIDDINPTILARNLLFCYVITSGKFDSEKHEDLEFLWDVWYNTEWDESTTTRFLKCVLELLQGAKVTGVSISDQDKQSIYKVWRQWIVSIFTADVKKVREERRQFLLEGSTARSMAENNSPEVDSDITLESVANDGAAVAVLMFSRHTVDGREKQLLHQKHRKEFCHYFKTGNAFPRCYSSRKPVSINPAFLNPQTGTWWVQELLSPFHSYPPVQGFFDDTDETATELCQKKLKMMARAFQERVCAGKATLSFFLGNAVDLCVHRLASEKYDVIDCSNLVDHVGFANLVPFAGNLLTSQGRLVTESMTWDRNFKSVAEFLETSLCAPVSMFPTLYGVRLLTNITLGCCFESTDLFLSVLDTFVMLVWAPAPVVSIPPPEIGRPCSFFAKWISSMMETCSPLQQMGPRPFELLTLTPYTLALILWRLAERNRMSGASFRKFMLEDVKVPPQFRVTWMAATHWLSGGTVCKYSAVVETDGDLFNNRRGQTPGLRLILFRDSTSINPFTFLLLGICNPDPSAAVFDNLQLVFESNGMKKATVSFFAPGDFNIRRYKACVILAEHLPFTGIFGTDRFKKEDCRLPAPKPVIGPEAPTNRTSMDCFTLLACREEPKFYEITLKLNHLRNLSVELHFDTEPPGCQAAHYGTVSLSAAKGVTPYRMSFSWPVLSHSSSVSFEMSAKKLVLRFPKALQELWPSDWVDYQETNDLLNPDYLPPWPPTDDIGPYLLTQFTFDQMERQQHDPCPKWDGDPLLGLKETIKILFLRSLNEGQQCFSIVKSRASAEGEWYIRVHLPVRRSSTGRPVLVVTALDHALSLKLANKGLLKKDETRRRLDALFEAVDNPTRNIYCIQCDEAQQELLKMLLHRNTLKMKPSKWQQANVPLGPHSAWVASFICPLLVEHPGGTLSVDDVMDLF